MPISTIIGGVLAGVPFALALACGAWIIALVVGMGVTGLSVSRYRALRMIGDIYYMSTRGMPELVLLFLIYFGLGTSVGLNSYSAGIIALGLAQSPFAAEYLRAALKTVGVGQREARQSVGLSNTAVRLHIIGPQAARFAITPMLNVFIGLLKFSSLASAIGWREIIARQQELISRGIGDLVYLHVTVATCIVYVVTVLPISLVVDSYTKRLVK